MLVDDPVKRVDNMTMAWGLEARVPFLDHELVELAATCPPELKTAHGGKGVLKEAARRVIPAEVIDRPKGYFPVPALTHLGALPGPGARRALRAGGQGAGTVPPEAVDALLADPNGRLTPLRGNELWQIALLEAVAASGTASTRGRGMTASEDREDRRQPMDRRRRAPKPSPSGCTTRHLRTSLTSWRTTSCSNSVGAD